MGWKARRAAQPGTNDYAQRQYAIAVCVGERAGYKAGSNAVARQQVLGERMGLVACRHRASASVEVWLAAVAGNNPCMVLAVHQHVAMNEGRLLDVLAK